MNWYLVSSVIIILFWCGLLDTAAGLQWVPIRVGDKLPSNVICIDEKEGSYVGRAKSTSNVIFPAEVLEDGNSRIKDDDYSVLHKIRSEVLTTSTLDKCEWKPYYYRNHFDDIDQNSVRAGFYEANHDSIFIGRTFVRDNNKHISSIVLPSLKVTKRYEYVDPDDHPYEQWEYLSCDTNPVWVNASGNLSPNAVSAGTSNDGDDIYVARTKLSNGNFLTGYFIHAKNAAVFDDANAKSKKDSDEYNDSNESNYKTDNGYQVLIGEPDEYRWIDIEDGIVPDFALVNGKRDFEPCFIAKIDRTVRSITQTEAMDKKSGFSVLVQYEV